MISLSDNRIQQEITGVILVGRIYSIRANNPEILALVDYDLPEAEKQLSIWQLRHQDDCDIESKNPLCLNIRPTFFPDPEQRIQREKYVQRKRLKNFDPSGNQINRRFRH